ncbi:hypothetical protein DFS34DRAFT_648188 [Phlyctochytrium arcticum]|nr:hypothetical protein DFS34DRAFT_648188 [Phlyctochytrium arcticum]
MTSDLPPPPSSDSAARSETLLQLFDTLTTYETLRNASAKRLSQAFFDLAQTKYVLGPERVGAMAYDGRMQALKQIVIGEDGQISVCKTTSASNSSTLPKSETDIHNLSDTLASTTLRQRVPKVKVDSDTESTESKPDEQQSSKKSEDAAETNSKDVKEENGKKTKRNANPLQWFAPLPPASLRSAQTHFDRALEDLIELGNVSREINKLTKQINLLS